MSPARTDPAGLRALAGAEVGVSDWLAIDQDLVNLFADATLDHQFIHTDPVRASATAFGGTIAHGFLTLSLLSQMSFQAIAPVDGVEMSVNYGFERIRFLAAVRTGSWVRGRFTLRSVEDKTDGSLLCRFDVVVEIEGSDKPALSAEWLVLHILRA